MNWELFDWIIIGPALIAGLLVVSTHVPLGQVVLKRGIIFIDLAVAQVAALGVIAAGSMGWEENVYAVQLAAVGAALLAAAGLNWTEKYWPDIQEALIGTLFVLAATGSTGKASVGAGSKRSSLWYPSLKISIPAKVMPPPTIRQASVSARYNP